MRRGFLWLGVAWLGWVLSCGMPPVTPSQEPPPDTTQCRDDAVCRERDPAAVCVGGRCQCGASTTQCAPACDWSAAGALCRCVDLQQSASHCGGCGNACDGGACCDGRCCAAGAPCCDGSCCLIGQTCCNGQCVDRQTSAQHCGKCGRSCQAGEACCQGVCTNVTTDLNHCGGCQRVCPTQSCCDGVCCPSGQACCDGACTDLRYNAQHCGACGAICKTGAICCKGRCVDPSSDEHCGGCGQRCSGTLSPVIQTQAIRSDSQRTLTFAFADLPSPQTSDAITVTVEVFGNFGDSDKYADVFVAGEVRERIRGGEPVCNWVRTPSHTGRYQLDHAKLAGGVVQVQVVLSATVELELCEALRSRVVVTVDYGGQVCCQQRCVDAQRHRDHCGGCGKICASGARCCGGQCCGANDECCEGVCCGAVTGVGLWVHGLALHPGQPLVAAATSDGLQLLDLRKRSSLYLRANKQGVATLGVAFHPNGKVVAAAASDGAVTLHNASDGSLQRTLRAYSKAATAVAFDPTGTRLASASLDGTLHLWDTSSGALLWSYALGGSGFTALAYQPKTDRLATVASRSFVVFLDAKGTPQKTINMTRYSSSDVVSLAFRPDGRWLAVGMESREIHILELTNTTPVKVLANPGVPTQLAFHPNGKWLAAASSDKGLWIWDVARGQFHRTLFGHRSPVTSVVFAPGVSSWISGATTDRTLRVWRE